MELRKSGKSRLASSSPATVSWLHHFWLAFVIIANWADAVGVRRLLDVLFRVLFLAVSIPLVCAIIVFGLLYEHVLKKWAPVTAESKNSGIAWLVAMRISALMGAEDVLTVVDKALEADVEESDEEDLKAIKEASSLTTEEAIPRLLSDMMSDEAIASSRPTLLRLRSRIPSFLPYTYFVSVKCKGTTSVAKLLKNFCHMEVDERHEVAEETFEQKSFPDYYTFLVKLAISVPLTLNALRETLRRFLEKRNRFPVFKQSRFGQPSSHQGAKSAAWTDCLPSELLLKINEKCSASSEDIATSVIAAGLRSYAQLMTGLVPDDVNAMLLEKSLSDCPHGSRLKLPLQTAHDALMTLNKTRARLEKAELQVEKDLELWTFFKEALPGFLVRFLRNHYYGRNPVLLKHMYFQEESGRMSDILIRSVYHWTPLFRNALASFTIMHSPNGISIAILSEKRTIQSATLLAECISKAVNNLCISLSIQWDRRSPPSTPTNDK